MSGSKDKAWALKAWEKSYPASVRWHETIEPQTATRVVGHRG